MALWEDLFYRCLLIWFSWAWVKWSDVFFLNMNFSFVNFKALWSFRITFTAICDEKMMMTDASSLTNTVFIFTLATLCCVDTCLHPVLMVARSSARVEFSKCSQMCWSTAYEQLICTEGLFKKTNNNKPKPTVLKCDAYCFPVFKVGSESLIDCSNVE